VLDGVTDPLAPRANGANSHATAADLEDAERIVEKRSIPAAGALLPRPREHATVDDDCPDSNHAMIVRRTRTNAEDVDVIDGRDKSRRQPPRHHDRLPLRRRGGM
jgi:hypothetical protein